MHVPDQLLKSVVFLGKKLNPDDPLELGGTAFFIQYPTMAGGGFPYLVTARHVISSMHGYSCHFRANLKSGVTQDIELPIDKWHYHPSDDSVDIAVYPIEDFGKMKLDHLSIPQHMFLSGWNGINAPIGLGDEVFFAGLMQGFGPTNLHIVRTGNIALMPKGNTIPFSINGRKSNIEGYVIEGKSFGGMSGSPVFVRETVQFQPQHGRVQDTGKPYFGYGPFHLLGIALGHWEIKSDAVNDALNDAQRDQDKLHKGLSIVAPLSKLIEILNGPELYSLRDKAIAKARNKS